MNHFIELTLINGDRISVNISSIVLIKPAMNGCRIDLSTVNTEGKNVIWIVRESPEEVRELIRINE